MRMVASSGGGFFSSGCANLKGYLLSKPPIVLFTLSLAIIALVSVVVSFYIDDITLKTGDARKDWNIFLDRFSSLEFCVEDAPFPPPAAVVPTSPGRAWGSNSTSLVPQISRKLRNYTVPMMVVVVPTPEFISIPHNMTIFSGLVRPSQIGLEGVDGEENIEISIELPYDWNTTRCNTLVNRGCDVIKVYVCVTVSASEGVLPRSTSHPQECEPLTNSTQFDLEYRALMVPYKSSVHAKFQCRPGPVVRLQHKLDPALTVYLSLADKSTINLHLLHTSFFIFIMVFMIFMYAFFRGRTGRPDAPGRGGGTTAADEQKNVPLLSEAEV